MHDWGPVARVAWTAMFTCPRVPEHTVTGQPQRAVLAFGDVVLELSRWPVHTANVQPPRNHHHGAHEPTTARDLSRALSRHYEAATASSQFLAWRDETAPPASASEAVRSWLTALDSIVKLNRPTQVAHARYDWLAFAWNWGCRDNDGAGGESHDRDCLLRASWANAGAAVRPPPIAPRVKALAKAVG